MADQNTDVRNPGQNPLAYSARQLADSLGMSLRHVRRLASSGMLPRPCRLGRLCRWPAEEIHRWLAAGTPDRQQWDRVKDRREGRAG